jgi:ATP-dependent DNA ligase
LLVGATPPLHLTPATRDRAQAAEWLERFEGAGLDGVIAKPEDLPYAPGKRAMFKIKHAHRRLRRGRLPWHKTGQLIGSLLLGLRRRGRCITWA